MECNSVDKCASTSGKKLVQKRRSVGGPAHDGRREDFGVRIDGFENHVGVLCHGDQRRNPTAPILALVSFVPRLPILDSASRMNGNGSHTVIPILHVCRRGTPSRNIVTLPGRVRRSPRRCPSEGVKHICSVCLSLVQPAI